MKPKPPFRQIFQVTVKKEGSDIHIINEPSAYKVENPPVFVVGTGESRTLPETRNDRIDKPSELALIPVIAKLM